MGDRPRRRARHLGTRLLLAWDGAGNAFPYPRSPHLLTTARGNGIQLLLTYHDLAQVHATSTGADGMGPMRARLATIEQRLHPQPRPAILAEPLTRRENDVLRRLRGPLSLVEIARELDLSPNTVKTHTQALYRKLGAQSRAEAVSIARQRHLL